MSCWRLGIHAHVQIHNQGSEVYLRGLRVVLLKTEKDYSTEKGQKEFSGTEKDLTVYFPFYAILTYVWELSISS